MDDALRHSITKLATLHFTTTEEHSRRVMQLGEQPEQVHNLGAPVLDAIEQLEFLDATALEQRFGILIDRRAVLLTFHPAAYDSTPAIEELRHLLAALDSVAGIRVVITGTNSDIGSEEIRAELLAYVGAHPANTSYVESFGQLGYLSAMRLAGLVVGNSSSTVLEAPLLGVPSVLIGERQRGRPLSASVLVPGQGADAIGAAIERGLSEDFRSSVGGESVFGRPGFARRALEVLATGELPRPPRKHFVDLDFTERNSNA
jgi:UDP-hydrolysing UDP-N-acetyl-D-glucosamine 2-epimerase